MAITNKGMAVIHDLLHDVLDRVCAEAKKLMFISKRTVMTEHDVRCAVMLVVPCDLLKFAQAEAEKSIERYKSSQRNNPCTDGKLLLLDCYF